MFKLHVLLSICILNFVLFSQEYFEPIIPKEYIANRTSETMKMDGLPNEECWAKAPWTDLFQDIEGRKKQEPYFSTRVKILWDDEFIYFYAELEEKEVWANIKERDQVIFYDNDFEIFLKPYTNESHYCELEVNAFGAVWDLLLMNAYREGGPIITDWDMEDLKVGVNIDGTLNNWKKQDKGWSCEIAIPWSSLDELLFTKKHKETPEPWRLNFSRVQWETEITDKGYKKRKDIPEHNWVWCEQGAIDMHRPEHWGYLFFALNPGEIETDWKELEGARQYLFYLYRAQKDYLKRQYLEQKADPSYARHIQSLDVLEWKPDGKQVNPILLTTNFGFEISVDFRNVRLTINDSGELKEQALAPFVLAAWMHGDSRKTDEEWMNDFLKAKKYGITDLFIGAGPEELRRYVRLNNDLGLNIHGWVWTLNRPGDTIARKHPEWYEVNRNGDNSLEYNAYVGYYQWLSPFSEGAREHIKNNIRAVAELEGLKSVHLDYVRFCDVILGKALQPKYDLVQETEMPEYDYGYHPNAIAAYEEQTGVNPLKMDHPELSTEWRQFRLNAVTSLVNELADIVHEHGKQISAAVFPFPEMARSMVRQDWSNWNLDIVLPMIYHNFYEENMNWIEFATEQGVNELKGRMPLFTGLYIPALSPEELKIAIENAKNAGAKGVCFFEWNSLSEKHFNVLSGN